MTIKHKPPFAHGQRVRYLGYPSKESCSFPECGGQIYTVEHVEPRSRWSGPRSQWPESHVLTREDLDAGKAQPDGGWSWDPPEWFVDARNETGWRLNCVASAWEAE